MLTIIKYGRKFYEAMLLHYCGYIIIDGIITRIQHNGVTIAKRDVFGYIWYIEFKRKIGALWNHKILT